MSYFTDCLKKFDELPSEIKDRVGSAEAVKELQEIEERFGLPLGFVVVLVSIGELRLKDVAEYLQKQYDLSPERARVIKKELTEKIFSRFLGKSIRFKLLTRKGLKEILQNNLNELLESDDDIKEEFNQKLKYEIALADTEELREFIHYLETNKEKLTEKPLFLNDRQVEPTVANWIKAFIQFHGVEMFDNLLVSKFITTSRNGRQLEEKEKQKVRSLLLLYRNIKFFPDSFLGLPVERWDFLPLYEDDKREKFQPEQKREKQVFDKVKTLPKSSLPKSEHILTPWTESAPYKERLATIIQKHGLTDNQERILVDILESFMAGKISVYDLGSELRQGLALNAEAVALLLRDIYGYLVKPVAQFIPKYSNALLEDFGVSADDYPEPDNILTILNQIAIVKEAKSLEMEKKEEKEAEAKRAKKEAAEKAKADTVLAAKLEEKLKDMYKKVKTDKIRDEAAKFPDLLTEPEKFVKAFYQSINNRDRDKVIAALWILAENGKLWSLLADDKKIQDLFARHLVKKYGTEVADDFLENPEGAAYLLYFLRHLLVDTIKIADSEAAALVIHLVNEYNKSTGEDRELLAYGDIESQDFKWREVKVDQGKLVLV